MKRSTALLLALATLLAHVLTLAQDGRGGVGPPEDRAHVAFRLGRNLIQGVDGTWNPGGGFVESYPSLGWPLIAAVSELLRLPPTRSAQLLGLLCALGAVIVVSRFSPDRLAGVMAPFFCVASGVLAGAAGGGTELSTFAMVWVAALWALESGRGRALGALLCAGLALRPEGLLLTLLLLALALASRARNRPAHEPLPGQARVSLWAFGVPLVVFAALTGLRLGASGEALSPVLHAALEYDPQRVRAGLAYLADFVLRAGFPLLVVLPIAMFPLGLSPRGRRALVVGLAWCAWVAWNGGDALPLWSMLAPAVPPLAVAIQEALVVWVDSRATWPRAAAWSLFLAGLIGSALASRQPGDLGPIPLSALQRRWQSEQHSALPRLYATFPGRLGKVETLERDERLRAIGVFMRDSLPQSARILTPWPGAIGYLSRRTVYDLFGRTTPLPGEPRPRSPFGPLRTDLIRALDQDADYLVLTLLDAERPPVGRELVDDWLTHLDERGDERRRKAALFDSLRRFELISVPVPATSADPDSVSKLPLYLLRNRSLALQPELELSATPTGGFRVEVRHRGHVQLADLEIQGIDERGRIYNVTPPGRFVREGSVHARIDLQLMPTGNRSVRLFEGEIPPELRLRRLTAILRNPGSQAEVLFSGVSEQVRLEL